MRLEFNEVNTFCVAMPGRWPRMKERLERHVISCTKWPAITPEQLSGRYGTFEARLNPAQRACAASHAHLWHHIQASQLPYAFILEDDILFAEGWKQQLEELPDDPEWDAFFLNASEPLFPQDTWLPTQEQWFTGAYVISLRGVEWLLKSYTTMAEADCMTWNLQRRGHSYSRFPWPCVQENLDTYTGTDTRENQRKLEDLLGPKLAKYG
jgi:GR25 family glycosyltransferase involved in LPS biosynthesis